MSLSPERPASFSLSVPISYCGSLAFNLCLYPGLIYLSFLPGISVALYRKSVFPILWSLFVVAAFLLLQELLSPASVSIVPSQRSFLAGIPVWQSVRKTFRINLTRVRLLYGRGSTSKWERKRLVRCRRCCDMLCILSNSLLHDTTDESCDWSCFLKIRTNFFLNVRKLVSCHWRYEVFLLILKPGEVWLGLKVE